MTEESEELLEPKLNQFCSLLSEHAGSYGTNTETFQQTPSAPHIFTVFTVFRFLLRLHGRWVLVLGSNCSWATTAAHFQPEQRLLCGASDTLNTSHKSASKIFTVLGTFKGRVPRGRLTNHNAGRCDWQGAKPVSERAKAWVCIPGDLVHFLHRYLIQPVSTHRAESEHEPNTVNIRINKWWRGLDQLYLSIMTNSQCLHQQSRDIEQLFGVWWNSRQH